MELAGKKPVPGPPIGSDAGFEPSPWLVAAFPLVVSHVLKTRVDEGQ